MTTKFYLDVDAAGKVSADVIKATMAFHDGEFVGQMGTIYTFAFETRWERRDAVSYLNSRGYAARDKD